MDCDAVRQNLLHREVVTILKAATYCQETTCEDETGVIHHNPPKPIAMAERGWAKVRFSRARAIFSSARFTTWVHPVVTR